MSGVLIKVFALSHEAQGRTTGGLGRPGPDDADTRRCGIGDRNLDPVRVLATAEFDPNDIRRTASVRTGLDAADAPYPTTDEWQQLSATLCDQPFADYTGVSIEESSALSTSLIYPLERDWTDLRARSVSCAIVSIDDGTPLLGSKHA